MPPVSTEPVPDVEAFWRLKAAGFDSFQSMRGVAFSAVWQREGGGIDAVVASGWCGRRTAYNRLKSCRMAGFEPQLVMFEMREIDGWLALERQWVREIEKEHRFDDVGAVGRLFMRLAGTEKYQDSLEVD